MPATATKRSTKAKAPKSPKAKKPKPTEDQKMETMKREAAEREHLADLERNAGRAEVKYENAKIEAKGLKVLFEAAVQALRDAAKPGHPMLPFAPKLEQAPQPTAAPPAEASSDDKAAFDAEPVSAFGLPKGLQERLEADGIRTGKDLQGFIATFPPRKLAGVGDAARTKIQDAMAEWYEKRAGSNGEPIGEAVTMSDPGPAAKPVDAAGEAPEQAAKYKQAYGDFKAELDARIKGSGLAPSPLDEVNKDRKLKLIKHLAQREGVDRSTIYETVELESMLTRLHQMSNAAVRRTIEG